MALKLEDLHNYNTLVAAKGEEDEEPTPVLLLNKYRIRLLPLSSLPFVQNYSNISQLSLNSDDVLVIDSPIGATEKYSKKSIENSKKSMIKEEDESMEMEEDKENEGGENGPLVTSFLTLEKLQKGAPLNDIEIVGLDCEVQFFDANPIPFEDGVSLQRFLRLESSAHFSPAVDKLPIWISTISQNIPSVCWIASGRTQKNIQFSGVTRVIGHFNEINQKLIKQLNEAAGAAQVNRYRAVYDGIRKIATPTRESPGEVIIDMRWNTKSSLVLLEQPDNAADCIIKIDLGWRDNRFFIDESIFEQLFFVLNLADVLANPEKEVIFPMEYVKFGDLVKEMDDIVEACSHEDNVFASNEKNEEVTDKVWNIVRKCGDIKHATMLFKNFLQALTYGKIKSHVQEGNKSHLASLIRASKTCDFRMPILERLSTIEMMMEIGVESLRGRIINKFSSTLQFPADELTFILKTCENELTTGEGALNSSVVSLLPITMALATVNQIFGLLNEKDYVLLPELARRVLTKFTSGMIEKAKRGETETDYTFETTLPLLRMSKEKFMDKRPRIWTCENMSTVGAHCQTRIMTSLELESSMEHVSRIVNAGRPIREIVETEETQRKPTIEELNADYTVSHTVFSYLPKM
ncbi:CRE-ZWL-1 protein [Caenorhabditis remanei]|uniref:Protein zwilch n=1 Tax=Caenorhabditis remanei TaxID=31234 RepID=E3N005_CAERE|nr:CRE-ZWL-1 protein [Caenorhabditis remanei]